MDASANDFAKVLTQVPAPDSLRLSLSTSFVFSSQPWRTSALEHKHYRSHTGIPPSGSGSLLFAWPKQMTQHTWGINEPRRRICASTLARAFVITVTLMGVFTSTLPTFTLGSVGESRLPFEDEEEVEPEECISHGSSRESSRAGVRRNRAYGSRWPSTSFRTKLRFRCRSEQVGHRWANGLLAPLTC